MNADIQNQIPRALAGETSLWMNEVYFLIPNWKWIAAILSFLLGLVLLRISRGIIQQIKNKYGNHPRLPQALIYWLAEDVQFPLAWLIACGVWHIGLQIISVHERVENIIALGLHLLTLINLLRLAYLGAESIGLAMEDWVKKSGAGLDEQLVPFATKVLKIVVVCLGFLLSLQSLGFNVGAVLAGLGIGSLALALAAQDTAANLFGSITIILDRPFQRGDYIKVGDTEGTVTDVGFRSTRIRTPYTSIITVPNSVIAKERIDNLGVRSAHRWMHTFAVTATNPAVKIDQFVRRLREHLDANPMIIKQDTELFVKAIENGEVKIAMTCFLRPGSAEEEDVTQQETLLWMLNLTQEMQIQLPAKLLQ